jgi:RNA polymerase sigma factor (sigma-70 family)
MYSLAVLQPGPVANDAAGKKVYKHRSIRERVGRGHAGHGGQSMAISQMNCVIQHLRQAVTSADCGDLDDGRLLESFIRHHDEAAFRALVRRHGPMVMGVCRRLLDNHHDAEDAFQATFLVLARKARSVRPAAKVAQWLHGVARLAALKARRTAQKRKAWEKQIASLPEPAFVPPDPCQDLRLVLDQEVSHLPQNLRLPLILCDLEGRSIKEATGQLGWPQGTLAGRLARGRKMLAKRLTRKGLALSGGCVAVTLSEHAAAAVPTSLAASTVKAAIMIAGNRNSAIGAVPLAVATLTEGVLQTMNLSKLRMAGAIVLSALLVAFGSAFTAQHLAQGQQANDQQESKAAAIGKSDALTLTEKKLDGERTKSDDTTALVGVWWLVRKEEGGTTKEFPQGTGTVLRLTDDEFISYERRQDGAGVRQIRFYWRAVKSSKGQPDRIDLVDPDARDKAWKEGIYKLDGDKLIICWGEDKRPTEFATQPGSRTVTDVFKRPDKAPADVKSVAPTLDATKLHGEWWGTGKDEVHLFFGPGDSLEMLSLHGRSSKDTYVVDWTKTPYHLDWNLPDTENAGAKSKSFQTIMEFTPQGDIRIAASSTVTGLSEMV